MGNDSMNKPGYLGTPGGNIMKYQPNGVPVGGPVTIIGRGAK